MHVPKHNTYTSTYRDGDLSTSLGLLLGKKFSHPTATTLVPTLSWHPLVQLEAIPSYPVTCYLGEETNPHLATASFQRVVEGDRVPPEPPFLQGKYPSSLSSPS